MGDKRSFQEDFAMNNRFKKFKAHTTEVLNNMENTSEYNFIKYPKVQSSEASDKENVSLVEKMRPTNIAAYVGQKQVVGPGTVLNHLLEKGEILSMIFWGPPGCGKTSLTNVMACLSKEIMGDKVHIVNISAASSGVKSIKDAVAAAKDKSKLGCKTIVFMDKIHCFNKLQQDIFLPHVEAGTFTLIGCTTENPSYSLNPALLSRCRVFVFNKLSQCDIMEILCRAVEYMSRSNFKFDIDNRTIEWLAEACDGDARVALNTLEMSVLATANRSKPPYNNNIITIKDIRENLIKTNMLAEKDQSHHIYSALHKSIRAGKANASLYWMARIMAAKEDPVNIARRLVRISSEDIGLADPDALGVAVHTMHGCQMIGMPECDVLLGQCAVYLAKAPKSRSVYNALKKAEKVILEHKSSQPAVPSHMRCNSTQLQSEIGTSILVSNENYSEICLPAELSRLNFFK